MFGWVRVSAMGRTIGGSEKEIGARGSGESAQYPQNEHQRSEEYVRFLTKNTIKAQRRLIRFIPSYRKDLIGTPAMTSKWKKDGEATRRGKETRGKGS